MYLHRDLQILLERDNIKGDQHLFDDRVQVGIEYTMVTFYNYKLL